MEFDEFYLVKVGELNKDGTSYGITIIEKMGKQGDYAVE